MNFRLYTIVSVALSIPSSVQIEIANSAPIFRLNLWQICDVDNGWVWDMKARSEMTGIRKILVTHHKLKLQNKIRKDKPFFGTGIDSQEKSNSEYPHTGRGRGTSSHGECRHMDWGRGGRRLMASTDTWIGTAEVLMVSKNKDWGRVMSPHSVALNIPI